MITLDSFSSFALQLQLQSAILQLLRRPSSSFLHHIYNANFSSKVDNDQFRGEQSSGTDVIISKIFFQ
jgi:hypothetical protein